MHPPLTRLAARLAAPHPDGELLARFARHRDEAAFAALVHRHGPTVYGACRRVLGNPDDADDAFQAVFLVLVNRAESLAGRPALGDWLHGVAVRVSLKARTTFARLRKRERRAAGSRRESALDPPPPEPSPWLDRELAALPERLRRPVVGCLLQERPRAEVAAELGIPEGTLASRLDAARKRLAHRLARHRVPLALGGLLVPVPAAVSAAAVSRATDGAAVVIHQLANEVTKSMIPHKNWLALAAVGVLTAAVGGWLLAAGAKPPAVAQRPAPQPPPPAPKEPPEPEWMQKFRKAYELVPGQDVKRVAPPYLPERIDYELDGLYEGRPVDPVRDARNRQQSAEYSMFTTLFIEQDAAKLRMRMSLSMAALKGQPEERQGDNLLTVWDAVTLVTGLESPEVVIDPACKDHPLFAEKNRTVHGDFVTRKGAPLPQLVLQLETILRMECKVDVRLTLKEEEQTVFVVGGAFKVKPPEWRPKGPIDVYAEEQALNKKYNHSNSRENVVPNIKSAQYSGSPVDLVRFVGDRVRTRMVWDAPLPTEPQMSWYNHTLKNPTADEEKADRDPDKVLKVVAEHTGLTFKKETRKVPVLYLSAPPMK